MINHKKLSLLSSMYVTLAVIVAVLSIFSFTFAWYIKSSSYYLNITFANPIMVNLENTKTMVEPLSGDMEHLLPGSIINVNLAMSMQEDSSPAYVRARVVIEPETVYDEHGNKIDWVENGFILLDLEGHVESNWIKVDFSNNPDIKDEWYVLRRGGATPTARELVGGEEVLFLNGNVEFTTSLDNRFALKNVEIKFVVETIQTRGIADPLDLTNGQKNHAQWGSNR